MYCHLGKVVYKLENFSFVLSINAGCYKLYFFDGLIDEDWIYFEVKDDEGGETLKEQDIFEDNCEIINYHSFDKFYIWKSDSFTNDAAQRFSQKNDNKFVIRIEGVCNHDYDFVDLFYNGIKLTDRYGSFISKEEEKLLSVWTLGGFIDEEKNELVDLYERINGIYDYVNKLDAAAIISQLSIEIKRDCFTRRGDPETYRHVTQINTLPNNILSEVDMWLYSFLDLGERNLYHEYDESGDYKYYNLNSHVLKDLELLAWREKYFQKYNVEDHINGLIRLYLLQISEKFQNIEHLVRRQTRDLERSKWSKLECEAYGRPEVYKLLESKSIKNKSQKIIKRGIKVLLDDLSEKYFHNSFD